MTLALEGIRVIDVAQGVPGPQCAMLLGDLGAEVIKVEPPDGDWLRQIGPFVDDQSALFLQLNRGKKGISLDLKRPSDLETFRRIAATADVLIEGYRPGVMDRLGLSYDSLSGSNPRLVYCSISGWGSSGPLAELPASELDVQAFVGKNRQLGSPREAPVRVGYDIMCANASWAAGQAIMAALFAREQTGQGQKIETSLLHAAIALLQWTTAAESDPDEWAFRPLSGYGEPPDHGSSCRDGTFLYDLGRVEDEWQQLCQILEAEHLLTDPRFSTFMGRQRNAVELKQALEAVFADWSFVDLRAIIQDGLGGSIVPMHDLASLDGDPQVEALDVIHELPHPKLGTYRTLDLPWHFSEPIARLSREPAPTLDQHVAYFA